MRTRRDVRALQSEPALGAWELYECISECRHGATRESDTYLVMASVVAPDPCLNNYFIDATAQKVLPRQRS